MPAHSERFFANRDCPYFPCHPDADPAAFNCLFCYCPLYLVPRCGGAGVRLPNGLKDCTPCLFPHKPENYDAIIARLTQACRGAAPDPAGGLLAPRPSPRK